MSTAGLTKWFPRETKPTQHGWYDCIVRISSFVPPMSWSLYWDGVGFQVPFPMMVSRWRGQTRKAYEAQQRGKRK